MLTIYGGSGAAAELYSTCRSSHQVESYLELHTPGSEDYYRLVITGGSVTADAGQSPRYSATVTVDTALLPDDYLITLPFGTTAKLVRGVIRPSNGTLAWCYVFDGYVDVVARLRPEGQTEFTLTGWEGRLEEHTMYATSHPTTGNDVTDEIARIIHRTLPTAVVTIEAGVDTTTDADPTYTYSPGDSPLQHVLDLAKSIGAECYSTPTDDSVPHFIVRNVPPTGEFPAEPNVATPESIMTRSRSEVRRAVNMTRIRYEPAKPTTAKPVRNGEAEVTGGGPQDPDVMGPVVEFQRRTGYRTEALADAAAGRLLTQRSRKTRSVTWDQIPAPYLEPGDSVLVRVQTVEEDPTAAFDELCINRLTLPLVAGEDMQIVGRTTDYIEG